LIDSGHGLMVADEVVGSGSEFVTLVSLILCGFSEPFVRQKGEC
jgi:hypothetical protein